jgi:glycogen(starch) synthase
VTSRATHEILRELVSPGTALIPVGAGVPDELFELPRDEQDYLLYFGRLDWFQKGLDTLLGAVALLARARPGLELRIAGRGKDADRVAAVAEELGIARNLRMLGAVSDAERQRLFAGARVLLMPSRFEGFGMVAAEAMAAGVPVVAAAAGSLPEVVAPPHGGVLVPPGDPAALAGAVERLLADAPARQALSESARASAERFRWRAVARQHLEFLEHIHRDAGGVRTDRA